MANFSASLITPVVGIVSGIVGLAVGAFLNYRFSRKLEAFRWLHRKRAQVLFELYRLTSNTHYACVGVAEVPAVGKYMPSSERGKLRKDASSRALERAYESFEYADSNEALLPESLVCQLRDLHAKYLHLIATGIGRSIDGASPESQIAVIGGVAEDVAPLRGEIQRAIRKVLGAR